LLWRWLFSSGDPHELLDSCENLRLSRYVVGIELEVLTLPSVLDCDLVGRGPPVHDVFADAVLVATLDVPHDDAVLATQRGDDWHPAFKARGPSSTLLTPLKPLSLELLGRRHTSS
jgi:hypothetical protein